MPIFKLLRLIRPVQSSPACPPFPPSVSETHPSTEVGQGLVGSDGTSPQHLLSGLCPFIEMPKITTKNVSGGERYFTKQSFPLE